MTPFGLHMRQLRSERNITQKEMAKAIGVSPAYLSALEHGRRGKPPYALLQRIVGYLGIIWDDAEQLQEIANLSDPRVVIDTSNLSSEATQLANNLAQNIGRLSAAQVESLLQALDFKEVSEDH